MVTLVSAPPLLRVRLPRYAAPAALVFSFAVSALIGLLLGWGIVPITIVAGILFAVAFPGWAAVVEGRRSAVDKAATVVIWEAFLVICVPLVWLLVSVIGKGLPHVSWHFISTSMRNYTAGDPNSGGIIHALIGTLEITGIAALIAVPLGLMTAIYLVEYGGGSRLARIVTFLIDVMTGIPSIVAGLFALALFFLLVGPSAATMGFAGAVALSLLMAPTVVRSAEEMLRLVPNDLREASYALGVPRWRTILKVVMPTAIGGIVTGITLAISRVIGETAPLLMVAGISDSVNGNPFKGPMTTLPTYIYEQYAYPDTVHAKLGSLVRPESASVPRMWAAALILILIVMILNLIARVIGKIFAPKTGR